MRRLLGSLVVFVVLALLAAGCSGGDDDDDDLAATDRSTTTVAGLTSDTVDPAAPAGGSGGEEETGTTVKGRERTPATTTAPAPTSPPPPPPPGATFTTPGKYTYRVTGTASGQPVDTTSTLTVDPPNGADQRTSQSTQQGTQEQILRRQADGVYLVNLKINAGFVAKEFRFEPPALSFPIPPTIGRAWSWEARSTDGKTNVKSSFKILRNETIDVGGERVDTVVLELVTETSGDIVSTMTSTLWVSQRYSLIVRTDSKGTSPLGPSETSSKLQSTRPA
jgi:hypothetical protein